MNKIWKVSLYARIGYWPKICCNKYFCMSKKEHNQTNKHTDIFLKCELTPATMCGFFYSADL